MGMPEIKSNVIPLPTGQRISTWMHNHLVAPMVRDVDKDGPHLWSGTNRADLGASLKNGKGIGGAFYSFRAALTGLHRLWVKYKCVQDNLADSAYLVVDSSSGTISGTTNLGLQPTLGWRPGTTTQMTYMLTEGGSQSITLLHQFLFYRSSSN